LSYRDLEEMMAERGLSVVHVTVAGQRTYLYRAVDSEGDTIDFMLSPNRDLKKMKSSWSNDSGRRVRSAGAI
jgi:transposase-like protein